MSESKTPITDSVKVRNPRGLWIVNADYMVQVEVQLYEAETQLASSQAENQRLREALEAAQSILRDLSIYPVETAYPDGPCLKSGDMDEVDDALESIKQTLSAKPKTDEPS